MMSNISKDAELSLIYTNHCVRATCITNLDRKGTDERHIVGISGHKNNYSIISNSSRLTQEKQFEISKTLCESSTKSSIASSSNNKELDLLGDFNLCNDFDVELFLAGLENC